MSNILDYLSKRTQEQTKADREKQEREEQIARDKKNFEEELKYQESLDKQPSRFQEDLSKLTKKIVSGAKKGVNIAKPVIKGAIKSAKPIIKQAYVKGAPIVKQMAKGAAASEYPANKKSSGNQSSTQSNSSPQQDNRKKGEAISALINLGYSKTAARNAVSSAISEMPSSSTQAIIKAAMAKIAAGDVSEYDNAPPVQPSRQSPREPSREPTRRAFRDDMAPAPRISKNYDSNKLLPERPRKQVRNEDFFVSGHPPRAPGEDGSPRKKLTQPKGAETYFVNTHKTPKKPEKKPQVGKLQKKPTKKERSNSGRPRLDF